MIRVLAILPPAQSPVPPPSALIATALTPVSAHCGLGIDILSTAWHTVEPWSGARQYKLLEGEVQESKISHKDSNFNHSSQDWNIDVSPDPRHRVLLNRNSPAQSLVEVEWERDRLPERYRPTEGDRVSAIGYWIYDCDHGNPTEIHPPVLLAVHRPRAIVLPVSAGVGSNAHVPGIVTDIWVNREAGKITNGCSALGLRQQLHPSKPVVDIQGRPIPRCLPDSEGFSSNPINRTFEFNIYLPHSPQAVMAAVGKTVPAVPLHTAISNPDNSGGPEPVIEAITEGGITYLRVRINLGTYPRVTYSRRIVAAWAHAAPDNWGARRWDVSVNSLNVTDTADGDDDDGDWRFWVNTNNGESEWAKLFDCDNCVNGNVTFGGVPWRTNTASPHRLGPSIVLFPNQNIWLATTGYENDFFFEDGISPLFLNLPQQQVTDATAIALDASGKYTMHYDILGGESVGQALLTPSAKARFDAYSLTASDLHGLNSGTLTFLDASFRAAGKPRVPTVRTVEKQEREALSFEEMNVTQLRQAIARAQREGPAELDVLFRDLGRLIKRERSASNDAQVIQFLEALKPAVPPQLWRKHGLEDQLRGVAQK